MCIKKELRFTQLSLYWDGHPCVDPHRSDLFIRDAFCKLRQAESDKSIIEINSPLQRAIPFCPVGSRGCRQSPYFKGFADFSLLLFHSYQQKGFMVFPSDFGFFIMPTSNLAGARYPPLLIGG